MSCTQDQVNFDAGLCASGACNLLPDDSSFWKCTPLCNSESDCQSGQECGLMAYATQPNASAAPYHPQAAGPVYDGLTGCYTNIPNAGANLLTDGLPCQVDKPYQCRSNKCLGVGPTGDYRCTSYCATAADCTVGMKCKVAPLTLVSEYLLFMVDYGGQAPSLDANTYLQVCYTPAAP